MPVLAVTGPQILRRLNASALLIAVISSFGCTSNRHRTKPDGIPLSAVWSGGPDGGSYIDCLASEKGESNRCTVYNENTGDVEQSGAFGLNSGRSGASASQLKYDGAPDGIRIFLENAAILSPLPTIRPSGVPGSAFLAENGVYSDCVATRTELYRCSLFLAADGRKIGEGIFRCDSQLPECAGHLKPKIAGRKTIFLENAGALDAVDQKR